MAHLPRIVSVSILNVQRLRWSSLVAAIFITSVAAPAHIRAQDTPIPSGRLVMGASSLEFRPDGAFLLHGVFAGIGEVRATGTWKYQSGAIELAAHEVVAGAELLKAMSVPVDGCGTAGRYRFDMNGKQLRLSVIGDACAPRQMFLDKTRWAPPGEPNLATPRTVTRTMFDAAVRLPRAGDRSGHWPSFRGPQAAGIADEQHLPDRWNVETGENILWRTTIPGLGHSSPIVWGDRMFVTSAISSRAGATFKTGPYNGADASDDTSSHQWVLYALDTASGRIVWQKTAYEGSPRDKRHVKSTYASSTPATDGRVVVAWFGSQGLHAYTVEGTPLWKVDLGRVSAGAVESAAIEWGPASSPAIWDGLVILQVDTRDDSFLVALSAETGEQVWKTNRDEGPSWSSPTVVTTANGAELDRERRELRSRVRSTHRNRTLACCHRVTDRNADTNRRRRAVDRHQRRSGIVTPVCGGAPRRRWCSCAGRSFWPSGRTVGAGLEREGPRHRSRRRRSPIEASCTSSRPTGCSMPTMSRPARKSIAHACRSAAGSAHRRSLPTATSTYPTRTAELPSSRRSGRSDMSRPTTSESRSWPRRLCREASCSSAR